MKRGKRSQTTIFIIIGVILIVAILLFVILKKPVEPGKKTVHPNIQPVYSYVENCVKEVGERAILYIGTTGGYYNTVELSNDQGVAFYYYEKINHMPSKQKIASEISLFVDDNLKNCINNFEIFQEFNIRQEGEIKTSSIIENNKVVFNLNYPLSISKGPRTYDIEDFNDIEVFIRLGVIYNTISEYMQMQINESICMNCLNVLGTQNDLYIELEESENNEVLFLISDPKSVINGKNYEFYFANKYEVLEDE